MYWTNIIFVQIIYPFSRGFIFVSVRQFLFPAWRLRSRSFAKKKNLLPSTLASVRPSAKVSIIHATSLHLRALLNSSAYFQVLKQQRIMNESTHLCGRLIFEPFRLLFGIFCLLRTQCCTGKPCLPGQGPPDEGKNCDMPPFGIGPGPGTIHKGEAFLKVDTLNN